MSYTRFVTLLAAFALGANAFTYTNPSNLKLGRNAAAERRKILLQQFHVPRQTLTSFMAATPVSDTNDTADDAVLRSIESKIEAYNKKKAKAQESLNRAQSFLEKLETRKKDYMDGQQIADTPKGGNFSETTMRSAVKAIMWRIIAGSITFITSLRFSGSLATALTIVGSDFFSKAFTMFIGERLMNKSSAGRKAGGDNAARSLAKALIWRVFAICNTLTMAFFIAKDLTMASKIAGSDAIFKTGLMFFYERIWSNVQWGKEYLIEFSI